MQTEFVDVFSQGRQHLHQKDWPAAVTALEQAVSLKPEAWAVRGLLGLALLQSGQYRAAIATLRRTLREQPDHIPARLNLGIACFAVGELAQCEAEMAAVVAQNPDSVEAWEYLASSREGRGLLAIDARSRLVELCPESAEMWEALGKTWTRAAAPRPAVRCYRRVLALCPDDAPARCRLGELLIDLGEIDEAEVLLEGVRQKHPTSAAVLTALARIRSWRRDEAGARALIALLVARRPPPIAAAALWAELSRETPQQARGVVSAALASAQSRAEKNLLLHRLGDLCDAQGDHDAAFAAWQEANTLRKARFDPDGHDRAIQALIDAYSGPVVSSGLDSAVPVFVVGMPRSGTSLVEQMLDRHPGIVGAGELESIREIAVSLSGPRDYYLQLARLDEQRLREPARGHLSWLEERGSGALVIDKMPNNFLHLGLISQLFPGARVLHCVRDPQDTCLSCFRQRFGAGLPHTTRLDWLGRYYRSYARLMAHWMETLPITILPVQYEDLVRQPQQTMGAVLSVLGVPWDERCLSPHRSQRIVATASRQQVQQPLHARSIGRSVPYTGHLAALRSALSGEG